MDDPRNHKSGFVSVFYDALSDLMNPLPLTEHTALEDAISIEWYGDSDSEDDYSEESKP